jgi:hypothetical protein
MLDGADDEDASHVQVFEAQRTGFTNPAGHQRFASYQLT